MSDAPGSSFSPLRSLAQRARPHRRLFLGVALFASLGALAGVAEPLIYRYAINDVAGVFVKKAQDTAVEPAAVKPHERRPHAQHHVAGRTVTEAVSTLLLAVLLLFLTGFISKQFALMADNMAGRVGNRIEEGLIGATFERVLGLPMDFFSRNSSGSLTKRIDQVDQVLPVVTVFSKDIVPEAIRLTGILAVMLSEGPSMTFLALLPLPAYIWLAYRVTKQLEPTSEAYYELWQDLRARIQEVLSNIKTVRVSGSEGRELERFSAQAAQAYETDNWRRKVQNRYLSWQSLMVQAGKALVLGYGGWKVLEHQITPGDVVMFVAYIDRIYDPINYLSGLGIVLQQHLVSISQALDLQAEPRVSSLGTALGPGPGRVDFEGVRFGYTPSREVLRGVSLGIQPGSLTALVGPSGAGKTTLSDLLLKLYAPSGGRILVDGQDLAAVDASSLRRSIGVVAADGAVFQGTLADNIRYQRPEATDPEVLEAAAMAGLRSAVERLPQGLATVVGERGMGLSVGERQRLQIARAFAARPRLLILDEATANLDYATELDLKNTIQSMRGSCTILVIAHRYSMVKDADQVFVLDEGKVVESGTPAGLLRTGGWFSKLARSSGVS